MAPVEVAMSKCLVVIPFSVRVSLNAVTCEGPRMKLWRSTWNSMISNITCEKDCKLIFRSYYCYVSTYYKIITLYNTEFDIFVGLKIWESASKGTILLGRNCKREEIPVGPERMWSNWNVLTSIENLWNCGSIQYNSNLQMQDVCRVRVHRKIHMFNFAEGCQIGADAKWLEKVLPLMEVNGLTPPGFPRRN